MSKSSDSCSVFAPWLQPQQLRCVPKSNRADGGAFAWEPKFLRFFVFIFLEMLEETSAFALSFSLISPSIYLSTLNPNRPLSFPQDSVWGSLFFSFHSLLLGDFSPQLQPRAPCGRFQNHQLLTPVLTALLNFGQFPNWRPGCSPNNSNMTLKQGFSFPTRPPHFITFLCNLMAPTF